VSHASGGSVMAGLRGWESNAAHNGGSPLGMLEVEFMRIDFRLTKRGL
jgi:hypothetical protein